MQLSEHKMPSPEALQGFIEGVHSLQEYLRTNEGELLSDAEKWLDESLAADPGFAPAQYYKAVVLTYARKTDDAIRLLEALEQSNAPFKVEVLYNLAFAYAKKYKYEFLQKAIETLNEAQRSAPTQPRCDLVLLIQAMRAWVLAVFAGREYKHPEDFEERQRRFLPESTQLAESVLADRRLRSLGLEARTAIEVEAHNAAGIAYMRMGQYVATDPKSRDSNWNRAEEHFSLALDAHPRDVRVLDNVSTLRLIQACCAVKQSRNVEVQRFSQLAKEAANRAISYNPSDRFRWHRLAKSLALLGEVDAAKSAADKILNYPGEVTTDQVEKLKNAIDPLDADVMCEGLSSQEFCH